MVLPPHDRRGFTLVELAIVLVIMGLLVGGVLVGRDLIRAAELRSVVNEYNQYKVAISAFKQQYMALPGDMPNAVRFWGAQAGATTDGVDATCAALTTAATGTATCNGDGDGRVVNYFVGPTNWHETFRAWQHLASAGLVSGQFSGVAGALGYRHGILGVNLPASKYPNGGWSILGFGSASPCTGTCLTIGYFVTQYGNILAFGGTAYAAGHYLPYCSPRKRMAST